MDQEDHLFVWSCINCWKWLKMRMQPQAGEKAILGLAIKNLMTSAVKTRRLIEGAWERTGKFVFLYISDLTFIFNRHAHAFDTKVEEFGVARRQGDDVGKGSIVSFAVSVFTRAQGGEQTLTQAMKTELLWLKATNPRNVSLSNNEQWRKCC